MCFNHVYPQWHRRYKLVVVQNILKSLYKLDLTQYIYRIIHIPKENGTNETRPLGIPSPSWRVFLHGLNNILLVWLHPYMHPSQHGFTPKKGTLTAWQELLTYTSSRSIYEFDIRKYFDSVNLHYLRNVLSITGIPDNILEYIITWNQQLPTKSAQHGLTWSTPLEEASDYKYSITGIALQGFTDYEY